MAKRWFYCVLILLFIPLNITASSKREIRAVWVTTLSGLDWPSTYATTPASIEKQKNELRTLLDSLQRIHINTILFQTRIRGTVVYPSALEPWDGCLTGVPGKAPGYDPLAFAVDECHSRGMEIHAWVVAFPLLDERPTRLLGKKSIQRKHPELCRRTKKGWMMDPGVPGTASYLADICGEIAQNYDIDGIHLDYIRYPEKVVGFEDRATYRRYGKKKTLAEWRRNNVTECVKAINQKVKSLKPWIKISCAPIGKADDLSRFRSYGWNAYHTVHQDAQAWLKSGLMDILFPMMYFRDNHFYPFVFDWTEQSAQKPIVPGLGVYFLDRREKDWPLRTLADEIHFLRASGCMGQAYFRSRFITNDTKGFYRFLMNLYNKPALPTALTESIAESRPLLPPTGLKMQIDADSVTFTWDKATTTSNGLSTRYNLYASSSYPVDTENPDHLIAASLPGNVYKLSLARYYAAKKQYVLTAMNRYGRESQSVAFNVIDNAETKLKGLVCDGHTLLLPPRESEFALFINNFGRMERILPYKDTVNVAAFPPGFYRVHTLDAGGKTHEVGFFAK